MTPDEIAAMVADCDACDGTGTIQDELQSAMGGTPWNDCMTCYKVRALAAELDHRDLVHVNEVIALQRAVDGRGETIDALEDELTPLRAQLEAVTTERDRYKAALERIAENGTHHDLTPTKKMWGADRKPLDEANEIWWHAWIKRMDEQVKTIAREALKGAGQ